MWGKWRKSQVHPLWWALWWKQIQYYPIIKGQKTLAQQWHHLDRFGTVYDTVNWDAGPQNVFLYKICKITFCSKRHMQLSINRQDKSWAAEEIIQEHSNSSTSCSVEQSRAASGLIHDKNLSAWCMKPEDEKHPTRNWCHIMQTMDAWYAFKAHTVYLQHSRMCDRILTLLDAIPDPFAADIRYHRSCWKKYVSPYNIFFSLKYERCSSNIYAWLCLKSMSCKLYRACCLIIRPYWATLGWPQWQEVKQHQGNASKSIFGKKKISFHDCHRKNESILVHNTSATLKQPFIHWVSVMISCSTMLLDANRESVNCQELR